MVGEQEVESKGEQEAEEADAYSEQACGLEDEYMPVEGVGGGGEGGEREGGGGEEGVGGGGWGDVRWWTWHGRQVCV